MGMIKRYPRPVIVMSTPMDMGIVLCWPECPSQARCDDDSLLTIFWHFRPLGSLTNGCLASWIMLFLCLNHFIKPPKIYLRKICLNPTVIVSHVACYSLARTNPVIWDALRGNKNCHLRRNIIGRSFDFVGRLYWKPGILADLPWRTPEETRRPFIRCEV